MRFCYPKRQNINSHSTGVSFALAHTAAAISSGTWAICVTPNRYHPSVLIVRLEDLGSRSIARHLWVTTIADPAVQHLLTEGGLPRESLREFLSIKLADQELACASALTPLRQDDRFQEVSLENHVSLVAIHTSYVVSGLSGSNLGAQVRLLARD